MDRNFFRRIEVMFPILDPALKARIRKDLDICLADNTQSWQLRADGRYVRIEHCEEVQSVAAQLTLLRELAESY